MEIINVVKEKEHKMEINEDKGTENFFKNAYRIIRTFTRKNCFLVNYFNWGIFFVQGLLPTTR